MASEVKLPGSETVDGGGEGERKGGSEKGEREEVRRERGRKNGESRVEWSEEKSLTKSVYLRSLSL